MLQPALATAFQMDEEEPEIAAIESGQTYLVYEVPTSQAAAVAPFAEIEDAVEARWRATEGHEGRVSRGRPGYRTRAVGQDDCAALAEEERRVPPAQSVDMTREDLARQREQRDPAADRPAVQHGRRERRNGSKRATMPVFSLSMSISVMGEIAEDDPLIAQAHRQMGHVAGR